MDDGRIDEDLLSISVRSYGYLKKPEKQRYYEYALLDPKDSPFVNFRYHFMTLGKTFRSFYSNISSCFGVPRAT